MGTGSFLGVKLRGVALITQPHTAPRLKEEYSYTSAPLWAFVACSRENFTFSFYIDKSRIAVNPLNAELNPIRHLLALVGARHIVHVSRIRVKATVL